MRSRRYLAPSPQPVLLLLCMFCLPRCLPAQTNKLVVSPPEPVSIQRGAEAVVTTQIATLPGFHVNSNAPKDEFLIPLKLTWNESPLQAKSVTYPKSEEIHVGADTLSVFTGKFTIHTSFVAPANASPGTITVTGKLKYQACNNQMCFRPTTVDVRQPVAIN